jgi:HlyD family secretion protein
MKTLPVSLLIVSAAIGISGCIPLPKDDSQAQTNPQPTPKPTAVDGAIARVESLVDNIEYPGTTAPIREVSLRSQIEGRLVSLAVDVGDLVSQGQTIGRQDGALLNTSVLQAEAELAARQSEVATAVTQVSNARTQVVQARLRLQQAKTDAARFAQLANQGATSRQAAEQAQTSADTAEQALRSSEAQVRAQQNAVIAAQRRVEAQTAVLAQAKERLSYANLKSPTDGSVLAKVTEPGNLLQPGTEVIKLGDFSQIKAVIQVSELERAGLKIGQNATVKLDALPERIFLGKISRISPAADPASRLIPIEVTVPNQNRQIGGGLSARVTFAQDLAQRVVVPQTALAAGLRGQAQQRGESENSRQGIVFAIIGQGKETKVTAKQVQLGAKADGKVEILSGLSPGEKFVARSGKPLKDGDLVALSVLSEQPSQKSP